MIIAECFKAFFEIIVIGVDRIIIVVTKTIMTRTDYIIKIVAV